MSVKIEIMFYNDHRQDEKVRRRIAGSESDHIIVITKEKLVKNLDVDVMGVPDDCGYLFSPLDEDAPRMIGSELLGGRLGDRDVMTAPMDKGRLGQVKLERSLPWFIEKFVRSLDTEEQIILGVNMEGANTREAFAVCYVSAYMPMLVFSGDKGSNTFPTIPRYVPLNGEQLSVLKMFHYTFYEDSAKPILSSSDLSENTGKPKRNVDRALEFLRENGLIEKTDAEKVRRSAGKIPACYSITDKGMTILQINLRARGILSYYEDPEKEFSNAAHHVKPKTSTKSE